MTVVLALTEVTETVEPTEATAGKGVTDITGSCKSDALIAAAGCETGTIVDPDTEVGDGLAAAAIGVTETGLEDSEVLELTGTAAVGVSAVETAPATGA